MSNTISLTVATDDYNALARASDMLHGLAVDLSKQPAGAYPDAKPPIAYAAGVAVTPELALAETVQASVAAAEAAVQSGPQFVTHLEGVDIFTDTEINLAQHGQLTPEQQAAFKGRVVANPTTTQKMAAAFAENLPADSFPALAAGGAREQNNEGDTIGGDCAEALNGAVFAENPVDPKAAPVAATATAPAGFTATPTSAPAAAALPASVQLQDGIPWDHRIHGSGKKALAKAPHGWKLKRKPAEMDVAQWDAYVLEVEAELRAVMAVPNVAPAAVPATTAPTAATTAAPTPAPAPAPAAPTTPTPAATVATATPGSIATMAQLMPAVTAAGIDPGTLLAAVQSVGLQSIPLLGARPDLIPGVVTALGLGV